MNDFRLSVLLLLLTNILIAQDLYVGSDSYLTLKPGSSIAINGLVLSPSINYNLNSNTSIERLSTAAATGNNSILRQYTFSQALTNFMGVLLFHYEDAELNGAEEDQLSLQLYGSDALWHPYGADVNTNINTLTYIFNIDVDFSIVTADVMEALNIKTLIPLDQLRVYPNPTSNVVNIYYPFAIRTTLYNIIGQILQKDTSHRIDLSKYKDATYFLNIEDPIKKTSKTIKVIKI